MNSYERVMKTLDGEVPDRVPVIPLIREWPAAQLGWSLSDVLSDIDKHVFSQYHVALGLDYDCVYDLNAINAEAEALGSVLKENDICVSKYLIEDYDRGWHRLKVVDPLKDGRLPTILEGTRRLKAIAGFRKVVVGYMQSPFRLACMLRGPNRILTDCIRRPGELSRLMEFCSQNQAVYGMALIEAGVDIVDMSDPLASGDVISRDFSGEFSFKYSRSVIQSLREAGAKVSYHVCGDTTDRLDMLAGLGADVLSLDHKVDMGIAREQLGPGICLLGNVDPEILLSGNPEEIRAISQGCIEAAGQDGGFILSSGCLIPAESPLDNVKAMVDTAISYRYRT